ncbi:MAG: hypothetical protein KF895_02865 [Parvibaculum sp.]|nr:hypothetical protein [Parvibaculum sp.]
MAKIIVDIKADTSEVRAIIEECARLVSERAIPDHLISEIEALAEPNEKQGDDMVRMVMEGDVLVGVPGPRLLALVANLRACAVR